MFKVTQILETGEECTAYEGSEVQCYAWIHENCDDYPESQFAVEDSAPPPHYPEYDDFEDDEV